MGSFTSTNFAENNNGRLERFWHDFSLPTTIVHHSAVRNLPKRLSDAFFFSIT